MNTTQNYTDWVRHVGDDLERLLSNAEVKPLADLDKFYGAGFYAIYYVGKHKPVKAYERITRRNQGGRWAEPIYIGVADDGKSLRGSNPQAGTALYNALKKHAKSIEMVNDHLLLDIRDFYFRYVLNDPLNSDIAKRVLIDRLAPVWNTVIPGFANHNVGKTRLGQRRSSWDILHMGRPWSSMCAWNERGTIEIMTALKAHYDIRALYRKKLASEKRAEQKRMARMKTQ